VINQLLFLGEWLGCFDVQHIMPRTLSIVIGTVSKLGAAQDK